MTPFITVVMPVRNEARFIGETLMQLVQQEYPSDRFEILVVDGMSEDGTREIVAGLSSRHPNIRLLENPRCLSSSGRNIGFKSGRGDYFLVIDGHCFIPSRDMLASVSDCFARSKADCLGRPQPLDPPGVTPFQAAVAMVRASPLGHGAGSLIYGEAEGYASPVSNGAAYTRRVFEVVGYVDESFDAAEDVEFNYRVERAGLVSYTSHKLTVRYYPREGLGLLFRQMKRYGTGRRRFIGKHREALTVTQLVPPLFAAGLVPALAAGGCSFFLGGGGLLSLLLAFPYALYVCAVTVETGRLARKLGWRMAPVLPAIFVVIHLGLGVGFLTGSRGR